VSELEAVSSVRDAPPIWQQWNLISNFGRRDLKAKFKGTWLGWAWSLLVPLASLGIYTLVFSVVFRMAPPELGNGRSGIFALWLFAGLILWSFFSSSINAGIAGLGSSGGMLQKVYFPAYAPVLGAGLAVGVQSVIEVSILLVILLILGNVGWTWLLVPVLLALYIVFCWSVATAISILNVYYRDLAHLVNVALQLLFYVTPILYTIDFVPEVWRGIPIRSIITFSPLADFIILFRNLTYDLTVGDLGAWVSVVVWTLVALGWASWTFHRRGADLGEQL
jgi:ABC-type polysaccharide/polyol phosphate export systems, permease component